MDSPIKPQKKILCNVFEIACDFCGEAKSRRDGLSANVRGRNRFLCAGCSERVGALSYSDYFGLEEWSIFPAEETAA